MITNALIVQVKATNAAHKAVMDLYPVLRNIFEPYIGKKVLKADGCLLSDIHKSIVAVHDRFPDICIRRNLTWELAWAVKANKESEGITYYSTAYLHMGQIDVVDNKATLVSLANAPKLRIDYTAEEVEQKRDAVKIASNAFSAAKKALSPFELFDI